MRSFFPQGAPQNYFILKYIKTIKNIRFIIQTVSCFLKTSNKVFAFKRPRRADGATGRRGYLGERVAAWEGSRGESFLRNVELRGGELLVPRAGLYYIYAQTYFRLSSTWSRDQEDDSDHDPEHDQEQEAAQLVQYIYKKVRTTIHVAIFPPQIV